MPDLVCDTSALTALHQIGHLHILRSLSSTVFVPSAVEKELRVGREEGHDVPDVLREPWLTLHVPQARPALPNARQLGAGESDVLWAAMELPGSVAILDDAPARRIARQLGIPYAGTLGLLQDAKRRGLVTAIAPLLDALEHHRFRMSASLRVAILQAAGEGPIPQTPPTDA